MKKIALLGLMMSANVFSMSGSDIQKESLIYHNNPVIVEMNVALSFDDYYFKRPEYLAQLKHMFETEAPDLSRAVIDKVINSLSCANHYHIQHNHILSVIDYSRPSNEKRLWIFDLKANKLLFYTYVTHGIKSGTLLTSFFSNTNNSKATSLGVYKTEKLYYGRDGISLRLNGLDRSFNDNAMNRYVVMHGGWYVDEPFIKKYGRPGRSWGCPAVPLNLVKPIIETIKNDSLFVAYYPSDAWFARSKFLNCNVQNGPSSETTSIQRTVSPVAAATLNDAKEVEVREDVLLANLSKNKNRVSREVIAVIKADVYSQLFQKPVPLGRMLRRQINNEEYIAVSQSELETVITADLGRLFFVEPVIKNVRGYYETQMNIVPLGKIKSVKLSQQDAHKVLYTVDFEQSPSISLRTSNQFIRWLGL